MQTRDAITTSDAPHPCWSIISGHRLLWLPRRPRAAAGARLWRCGLDPTDLAPVMNTPATAKTQTGYCTSQAIRNASGVKPPSAVKTPPIAASTSNVARNPPRFTMLYATPRLASGFDVRAMSLPTTEPGPPAERTTTRRMKSHDGTGPECASTAVQVSTLAAMTVSGSQDRRLGNLVVSTPMLEGRGPGTPRARSRF